MMNKKISIIGSFNLADGYLGAAKALERKGFEVSFIPAQKYKSEQEKQHTEFIKKDLKEQSPDIFLWWRSETLNAKEFENLTKEFKCLHILYSWDDPFQWEKHQELPDKCKSLDMAFTCCEGSIEMYEKNGCKAFYCPPGFDPEIHYPEEDEKYKCDISLVCTNLYHGFALTKKPHLSRKMVLNEIIKSNKDKDIRLYGTENLKDFFPNIYKGFIPFNEARKVFYNSRINICTHIRPDGYKYINERVTQILGSKGLLYVDYVNGMQNVLNLEKECVLINPVDIGNQVKYILENYDKYTEIKELGYQKAISNFTWDNWADIMCKKIYNEN